MVLGVIIGECAAMLGLMESKLHVDKYHTYSCTELLDFLPSSTLKGIHTRMQLVKAKALIQPIQNRIE